MIQLPEVLRMDTYPLNEQLSLTEVHLEDLPDIQNEINQFIEEEWNPFVAHISLFLLAPFSNLNMQFLEFPKSNKHS